MSGEQTTKENATMNARKTTNVTRLVAGRAALVAALMALAVWVLPAAAATAAEPQAAWEISASSQPTHLVPGSNFSFNGPQLYLRAENVGSAPTSGTGPAREVVITDTLAEGLSPQYAYGRDDGGNEVWCEIYGQTVECIDEMNERPIYPGHQIQVTVLLKSIPAEASGSVLNEATVSGGEATSASTSNEAVISSTPASFGFLPGVEGLQAVLRSYDGSPDTEAGTHPAALSVTAHFPSYKYPSQLQALEHVHDVRVDLPPGTVVNPNATPVRCTEVQLESDGSGEGCPPASQVGTLAVRVVIGSVTTGPAPMYNMVPQKGQAALFGFDVTGLGIYVHLKAGTRYGPGGYRETAITDDITSKLAVLGVQATFWGNPSDTSHDDMRGFCTENNGPECPQEVEPQTGAVVTMPTACPSNRTIEGETDSWEKLGVFRNGTYTSPTAIAGCSHVEFHPTLEARPTTTVGDSPTGLSVDIHVPQHNDVSETATAQLRKAVVTLPEGLTLNPSGANGLESCSSSQIGISDSTGEPDNNPPNCPIGSRIGEVEVETPLLPNALPGTIYLATPYDNPFDSLVAIYAVVEDPVSGTLLKLPGHVEPNPDTGRLVTTFDDDPQLPFTDFKLKFFSGSTATLKTPALCGHYSTTSSLTPWTAPESGPPATPSDGYSISSNCSTDESAKPNNPQFDAGAVSPIGGKYTPFVLHLKRDDGTQEFSKVTVSPPPGLVAKLADTPACSDGAFATAEGKSGREEQANPSCPSDSRIGTVHVGAGAGPAPYYTEGAVYLGGPYKGAPVSMAIVTPAVAGPFDLGTVVTRVALHIDPVTAQITAEADPIPHILKGIPLDVRQADVSLDKPDFTRTGSSCDPLKVNGMLTSTVGGQADLENSYQLGNCANLGFKPQLGIRLKGSTKRGKNPKLIATLGAKEGEANIGATSVRLPRSEFLDQSHIKTVCTRVQFAAGAGNGAECPSGSIYGRAWARSPLLGYTLTGNAYLRSSNNKLPDLVVALQGPASQPIAINLDGRTDSVKGALRNSFEAVPDAPVTFFRLMLFGGKRGLVVNSRNICAHPYKAAVSFEAHNGASLVRRPNVKGQCHKHKRHHRRGQGRSSR